MERDSSRTYENEGNFRAGLSTSTSGASRESSCCCCSSLDISLPKTLFAGKLAVVLRPSTTSIGTAILMQARRMIEDCGKIKREELRHWRQHSPQSRFIRACDTCSANCRRELGSWVGVSTGEPGTRWSSLLTGEESPVLICGFKNLALGRAARLSSFFAENLDVWRDTSSTLECSRLLGCSSLSLSNAGRTGAGRLDGKRLGLRNDWTWERTSLSNESSPIAKEDTSLSDGSIHLR